MSSSANLGFEALEPVRKDLSAYKARIYDPAGGTGGMLSVSKEHLLDRAATPEEKERVEKFLTVHGQELSPTNYASCRA